MCVLVFGGRCYSTGKCALLLFWQLCFSDTVLRVLQMFRNLATHYTLGSAVIISVVVVLLNTPRWWAIRRSDPSQYGTADTRGAWMLNWTDTPTRRSKQVPRRRRRDRDGAKVGPVVQYSIHFSDLLWNWFEDTGIRFCWFFKSYELTYGSGVRTESAQPFNCCRFRSRARRFGRFESFLRTLVHNNIVLNKLVSL